MSPKGPLHPRGWGYSQFGPKIAGDLEGWEGSVAPQAGVWGGLRWVWEGAGPGRGDPAHPKGFVWGLCVPSDQCRGTEGLSPTVAGRKGNPSAHREPYLREKGNIPWALRPGCSCRCAGHGLYFL